MFVSSRNLPLGDIDFFAIFLNGFHHLAGGLIVDSEDSIENFGSRPARGERRVRFTQSGEKRLPQFWG